MAFFKKLGKTVGGAIKSASKVVSLKNAIGVATNPASALSIGKEALGRALETATQKQVAQVAAIVENEAANVGGKAPTYEVVNENGATSTMTAKNAATMVATGKGTLTTETKNDLASKSSDNSVSSWFKTALAGIMGAVGVRLGGNDAVNAAAGNAAGQIAQSALSTWLKNNWWKILLPVGLIVVVFMYAKRKPKQNWRKR